MVRIVKAPRSDNYNKKLGTPHFGQNLSGSKNDPEVKTKITRAKRAIRRVMVPWQGQPGGPFVTQKTIGGNTNWRSSPAAEALTDNPNPKFEPSDHPGKVEKKIRPLATRKGTAGHGKVVENYTGVTANRGQKINKR
jgi:hypothetical protein